MVGTCSHFSSQRQLEVKFLDYPQEGWGGSGGLVEVSSMMKGAGIKQIEEVVE